jgi:hypothetical protein
MAEIQVNMGEAIDFSPVPEAAYEVVFNKKPEMYTAEKTQSQNLKWFPEIVGSNGQDEFQEREFQKITPLGGKGAGFTEQLLQAFKIPYTASGEGETRVIAFDDDDVIGKRAIAHIKQKTYKKDDQSEEKIVNDIKSFSAMPD